MSIDTADLTQPASAPEPMTEAAAAPRIRWASVIWGIVFAAIAVSTIALVVDDRRSDGFGEWMLTLTPASIVAMALLTLGGIVLICGAIGLIRRLQRRRSLS